MRQATMNWLQKILGGFGREIVRVGFTIWAIQMFIHYAPKTAAECVTTIPIVGIKTNATQVFAVIVLMFAGLGAALLMRLGEKYIESRKK